MGFIVLTTVKEVRYWIFKETNGKVDVFADDEIASVVDAMKEHGDEFTHLDTLHRTYFEVRKVRLEEEKANGRILVSDALNAVATKTGIAMAPIEQGVLQQYNFCI